MTISHSVDNILFGCVFALRFIILTGVMHETAVQPGRENCVAFESSYHIDRGCECLAFESNGRSQGLFNSTHFPRAYPPGIGCLLYTFIGDMDEIVKITFLEFDLQASTSNRCGDYVRLFLDLDRPEVTDHHRPNSELCGNSSAILNRKHYSSKRSLVIEFHSDWIQTNNTGFSAFFQFVEKGQFEMLGGSKRWGTECDIDFYSNKNSKNGSFFSPRYPQNYPPNSRCLFAFHGQKDERVKLVFRRVQLAGASGHSCQFSDSITVRDGLSSNSTTVGGRGGGGGGGGGSSSTGLIIALICGQRDVQTFTSSGEQFQVEFRSTSDFQDQGFAASFEFLRKIRSPDVSVKTPTTTTTTTTMSTTTTKKQQHWNDELRRSKLVAISSGLQSTGDSPFLHDRASDVTTYLDATAKSICEQEFTSKQTATGTFSSPDYPLPYPEYAFCKYVFRGQVHERVQLVFTKFNLHYPAGDPNDPHDCDEDTPDMLTVTVFGGSKPLKISNYCGKKRPPMLMSISNSMELVFTSGALSNSTGFFGHFSFITNFGITNGEQESDSDCRFIFRSSSRSTSGTFTSPNFPGLYPRETECHYLFYGQEGDRVDINFVHFNVEGITPSCLEETQSDYIEFSNFNIPLTDRKMIRLCGDQDQSRTITSDGNFFRVTFRSNEIFDASGFEATYQFINSKDSSEPHSRSLNSYASSISFTVKTLAPSFQHLIAYILFVHVSSS